MLGPILTFAEHLIRRSFCLCLRGCSVTTSAEGGGDKCQVTLMRKANRICGGHEQGNDQKCAYPIWEPIYS